MCQRGKLENRGLRKIHGPQRDEVTAEWRRLHNEELNDLHSSPSIVRVMKSRRMCWAGHVARMGERKGVYRVFVREAEGKNYLEYIGVDGRIILKGILKKSVVRAWNRLVGSRMGRGGAVLWMR
jgi:hypothetical protein